MPSSILATLGKKRPLDTPKRMIERREKGRRRDIEREGERDVRDIRTRERVKGSRTEHSRTGCALS